MSKQAWEFIIPCPITFKFLNGMGMRIILNKRGGVGMGATRLELAPLPSLFKTLSARLAYVKFELKIP